MIDLDHHPVSEVSVSCLRVLLVILDAAQQGKTLTLREIGARLNWSSPTHYVPYCLRRLHTAGLVTYGARRGRTIRPLCRMTILRGA